MESIYESTRLRRLERALLVLEGLTLESEENDKVASIVYRIAHSALGFCNAREHHDKEWLKEIEQLEKSLKESGIVSVDKVFEERTVPTPNVAATIVDELYESDSYLDGSEREKYVAIVDSVLKRYNYV